MRRWLVLSLLLTAAALAASLYVWLGQYDRLADPLPVHWGIDGEPDGWVPREDAWWVLLMPPGLMALMVLLGLALPWLSPRPFDVDRFRPAFEHIMLLLVGLFGFIHVALLLEYLQTGIDGVRVMIVGLLLFFAFLGNVMGQVRRNFWVGVRTPWTLASETVWIRTHRQAAWLWVGYGFLAAVAVLFGAPLVPVFVGLMAVALWPAAYSLILYKRLERQGKLPEAMA